MFKTTYKDIEYEVSFTHYDKRLYYDDHGRRIITECWITRVQDDAELGLISPWNIRKHHVGFAYLHPNDRFCRETGRLYALLDALKPFPRDVRKHLGNAYHKWISDSRLQSKKDSIYTPTMSRAGSNFTTLIDDHGNVTTMFDYMSRFRC